MKVYVLLFIGFWNIIRIIKKYINMLLNMNVERRCIMIHQKKTKKTEIEVKKFGLYVRKFWNNDRKIIRLFVAKTKDYNE